jgi:probable HAF family extracellular repeat protein
MLMACGCACIGASAAAQGVPVMIDLGTLGGASSEAVALSDAGHVAGSSLRTDGAQHAFRWTPADGMVDLGTLGGAFSEAVAVTSRPARSRPTPRTCERCCSARERCRGGPTASRSRP